MMRMMVLCGVKQTIQMPPDESSDEEMDYDSDEDSIHIQLEKTTIENSTGHLSDESKEHLSWRLDKDESFSDWTIEVSITNKRNRKNAYHVHKVALAIGPKKSGYFEALLKSGQFSESSNSTSVVELSDDIAKCFPDFLDYLYAPPHEFASLINRNNRRVLQYFAKYFLVPKLTEDIYAFIEKDMSNLVHMEEYLTGFESSVSEDDDSMRIRALASKVCTENILHIEEDSTLLFGLPPVMFLHMVRTVRNSKAVFTLSDDKKCHICRLVIGYLWHHLENLHVSYFVDITDYLFFPDDVCKAGKIALALLEIIDHTGWEDDMDKDITILLTAVLSRYLTDKGDVDVGWVTTHVTPKLTFRVLSRLLGESLAKNKIKEKYIFDISCKMLGEVYDQPSGRVVKVSIKTSDSIEYILYLLRRKLNMLNYSMKIYAYYNVQGALNKANGIFKGNPETVLRIRHY